MSKHPRSPAPTASAVGPCPTIIQISRTPRHWKFTQHHRTTRPARECLRVLVNVLTERNVNIKKNNSIFLMFIEVQTTLQPLRGPFTLHETHCSLHFDKLQKNEIHSLTE